jgi:hypothetical protein
MIRACKSVAALAMSAAKLAANGIAWNKKAFMVSRPFFPPRVA